MWEITRPIVCKWTLGRELIRAGALPSVWECRYEAPARPGPRFLAHSSFRGHLYSNQAFKKGFFVQISSHEREICNFCDQRLNGSAGSFNPKLCLR